MKKSLAESLNRSPRAKVSEIEVDLPLPDRLIGIEIEAERTNNSVFNTRPPTGWTSVGDGSLRDGVEFKLVNPLSGMALAGAIRSFFSEFTLERRHTSSTHIHVDMLEEEVSMDTLQTLFLLAFMTEEVLYQIGDAGRKSCGFTNPLTYLTDLQIAALTLGQEEYNSKYHEVVSVHAGGRALSEFDFFSDVMSNANRYVGLNVQSLWRYGSVEFRYFPTPENEEQLLNWIRLVQSYVKAAQTVDSKIALEAIMQNESLYREFIDTFFYPWKELFYSHAEYGHAKTKLNYALTLAESSFVVEADIPSVSNVVQRFKRRKTQTSTENENVEPEEPAPQEDLPEAPETPLIEGYEFPPYYPQVSRIDLLYRQELWWLGDAVRSADTPHTDSSTQGQR